jgi:DNA polymerase-1
MTGKTEKEGKAAIAAFFSLYPGLKRSIAATQKYCYDKGYVRNVAGRYLRSPNIRSQDSGLRSYAERQSWNFLIQSTAAELLRMSMILVHNSRELKDLGVEMVLQVHDELVFNVPKGAEEAAAPIIEELVSHPYRYFGMKDLLVDTPGEIGFGKSWEEAKK